MTPIEKRNQLLAEKMIKNLRRRNMEAFYCPTAQDAVAQVQALIADGSSVTWGGSMTIRDMGLPQALRERGTLEVLDRDMVEDAQEKQQMYLRCSKEERTLCQFCLFTVITLILTLNIFLRLIRLLSIKIQTCGKNFFLMKLLLNC